MYNTLERRSGLISWPAILAIQFFHHHYYFAQSPHGVNTHMCVLPALVGAESRKLARQSRTYMRASCSAAPRCSKESVLGLFPIPIRSSGHIRSTPLLRCALEVSVWCRRHNSTVPSTMVMVLVAEGALLSRWASLLLLVTCSRRVHSSVCVVDTMSPDCKLR